MSIADKLTTVAKNAPKVYEAGKKAEYDRFWDNFQDYGNRKMYAYAFYQSGWNDNTFKPKYDLVLSGSSSDMFASSNITDLKGILEDYGVILDTQNSTAVLRMFNNAKMLTRLGRLDLSNANDTRNMCLNCVKLKSIDALVFSENTCSQFDIGGMFSGCVELEEVAIEGIIPKTISFQWSPKLNKASITSGINALSDNATGMTIVFSLTAVNNAFETAEDLADGTTSTEWTNLIATKPNWTISLV